MKQIKINNNWQIFNYKLKTSILTDESIRNNLRILFRNFSTKITPGNYSENLIDKTNFFKDYDLNEISDTDDSLDTKNNNKNKKQILPNIWDLVDLFIKVNPNVKYCIDYKTFYIYTNDFWKTINKDELTNLFIEFLKSNYPNTYKQFNLKNLDNVFLLLSHYGKFSMPKAIANSNSNGFLLPFLNGILNTKKLELSPHSPENFTTHIIPLNYSKEDSIKDTKFAQFINSIVKYNSSRLHVLRACLFLIFTNNLSYQIALYIYGPGGTGKSTLINLLFYLLGKEVTLSSSISQINSRFGVASITGKTLIVLNDMSLYRGQEPKNIKNIIASDPMEAEEKFKKPFSFTPKCFLVLVSNTIWDIKNSTTGLSRRMIYFPFDNIPKNKELDLFNIIPNGDVSGTLVPHLSGFINWILTCPEEYFKLIYEGGAKLTELISPDSIYVNPLQVFVKDCLIQHDGSHTRIGNNESDGNTLYGMYSKWCEVNGINKITFKSFSILLIDLLNQLGWNITKKRVDIGFIIKGVSINVLWHSNVFKLNNDQDKTENHFNINKDNINTDTIINDSDFDNKY